MVYKGKGFTLYFTCENFLRNKEKDEREKRLRWRSKKSMKLAKKQKTHMINEFPELYNGICVIRYKGQHAVATGAKDTT